MNQANTAAAIIEEDLDVIVDGLQTEWQSLAGKKLLIIGGAGFLGFYLVQAVLHYNRRHKNDPTLLIDLTVFDNFMRGMPGWLEELQKEHEFNVAKFDINTPLTKTHGEFHYIVHAASIASPKFYRKYPIETMDANVNGLRNVLEYAVDSKNTSTVVEGILFYSTSEIYGDPDPDNIPTAETYRGNVSCTGPRACYDESKRYGETLCVNFAQQRDVPIKIVRPFNNYGPGLKIDDARVLPDFVRDVLAERDIIMYSDGSPSRTFCYITDAIIGYYKVLVRGRNGEPYNIGMDKPEITVKELAIMVVEEARELFEYKGKVVMQNNEDSNYLVDNPNRRCPIIDKAREELDYDATIDVKSGLRRAMIWYAENQSVETNK